MNIGQKLTLGFLVLAALIGLVGIWGYTASQRISDSYGEVQAEFQNVMLASISVATEVKDAEGHLFLTMAMNDPSEEERFHDNYANLMEQIDLLSSTVDTRLGREQVESLRNAALSGQRQGKLLLDLFHNHPGAIVPFGAAAEHMRKFHNATSLVRKLALAIAKRRTFDSAIDAGSYAKRAEGHLMIYFFLHEYVDREKFFSRHKSLVGEIEVLDKSIRGIAGRKQLNQLKKAAEDLFSSGSALLAAYDDAPDGFDLKKHEFDLWVFHRAAKLAQDAGVHLGRLESAYMGSQFNQARQEASSIEYNVLTVVILASLIAVAVGGSIYLSVMRSIYKLRNFAIEVGGGNLDSSIYIDSKDELGLLARTLNVMARNLKKTMVSRESLSKEIDEKRATELRLKELEQILNRSPAIAFLWRAEKGMPVEFVSDNISRLGYEADEFISGRKPFASMLHPQDVESVIRETRMLADKPSQQNLFQEYRVVTRSGEILWFEGRTWIRRGPDNKASHYQGILVEITERKLAEQQEKEREQQLLQADKMITLGILVSGVAHEINNPNQLIASQIGILGRTLRDATPVLDRYREECGEFLIGGMEYAQIRDRLPTIVNNISQGSKRIRTIVKELKTYARDRPGSSDSSIQLNKIIESSLTLVANMVKKSTRHFSVSYAPELPEIQGNAGRLEQVAVNLIQNACQALKSAEDSIDLSTFFDKTSKKVVLEVKDEGIGIGKGDLEHITDPFFTTKRERGGVGLGLSISANIIREHEGELQFLSAESGGTIARVSFPVARKNHTAP